MSKGIENRDKLEKIIEAFKDINSESDSEGGGAFGLERRANMIAQEVEKKLLEEKISRLDRGYEGNTRRCSACGKERQLYKGDLERKVEFECGELVLKRSYYVCGNCGAKSFPLDEKLGLVKGKQQGRLRKKLSLLGVLTSYHQAPEVCNTMLGSERHAASLRRVLLREADMLEKASDIKTELSISSDDTLYLQIDGHMCPTREKRKDPTDQGFREAKAIIAYRDEDVAQVSENRNEILNRILKASVTTSDKFRDVVQGVYEQAGGAQAKNVVVLADGAKWIWNVASDVAPEAIQILDFAHTKEKLYDFAKVRFQHEPENIRPWVNQQVDLLFEDGVSKVIAEMEKYKDIAPALNEVVTYFNNNHSRMLYGSYRKRGLTIGSGAIESAGKQISRSRVKGPGMRWNVTDLNPLLSMRCAFLDRSWGKYWDLQEKIAA